MSTYSYDVDLVALGNGIAAHLDGYTVKHDDDKHWGFYLVPNDPAMPTLWGNGASYGKPLRISASWTRNEGGLLGYEETVPSINVSPTKTGAQIAKDITRRLMPDAQAFHTRRRERQVNTVNHYTGMRKLADEIAAIIGKPARHDDGPYMELWRESTIWTSNFDIAVNGPDSVTFKMSFMSRDKALRLAGCLKDIFGNGK